MPERIKLTFFGSGPVAAKSLEYLTENFEIEAVVTKPKPAHHRGDFPVVTLAEKLDLKIIYAATKAELTDVFKAKPVMSKMGVVIDYGVIIAKEVIDYFPLGIINSHFSLLPQWRGADPITFAVLSGQKQTGVSLMIINEKMDEGLIIAEGAYEMPSDITTPKLTEELINLSDALLVHYLPMYINDELKAVSQASVAKMMDMKLEATYSRKLTKEDGRINWEKPAAQLECEIRGFIEWPRSYTTIAGKDVIVTQARPETSSEQRAVSNVFATEDKEIAVQTCKDLLIIEKLKPAGKKEMTAKEFLLGYGPI
jgi:methionyl-tRNA formyltransferase